MAPRALTLKYRPQVFADLVGQDHVTSVITAALASGRVAQAFLFTGARGVGKTTSARILAKALNCQNRGSSPEPCNRCASCAEITQGVSLDVLEIDGASNRGIADVQQLRESVRFAPAGGRHRVVIIDEVHQLSNDAFAALLKTLEEPPAHLVFIFATTDPQKLPETIRSRTQRFDFARVPIRRVADRLLEIQRREASDADGVRFTLTDGAALLIAHKGEGSMRDAVSALDQVVSAGEPAVDEPLVRRVLGIADREAYFRIAGAVLGRDPKATLAELHAAFEKGLDPRELAEGLAEHFRNILVLQVDPDRGHDLVAASNEDLSRLARQGEGWSDTDLLRLMRLAAECQWPMRDSPQPLVHLEAAVLQMATLEPAETVAALLERLESLERRLAGAGGTSGGSTGSGGSPRATPPARSAPPPPARSAPADPARTRSAAGPTRPQASATAVADPPADVERDGEIESAWTRTVAAVNARKRMLGAFLEESRLVGLAGGSLVLSMDHLHRSVVDAPEHRAMVCEEMARAFGRPLELRCSVVEGVTQATQVAKADSLKPLIERAMEVFDGEVIDRGGRGGDRSA
jgi:DNA polymerase-3 subunit gamma/tau